jgi:LuxR family transcriptional regulator, quorum-sensing system regulator BjaR1
MPIERERLAEDLLSFAQAAPKATSEHALIGELMRRVECWGVTHAAGGVMSDAARTFKIGPRFGSINVAWAETYFGQQLYRDDPVVDFALRSERSDYWDKAFDPSGLSRPAERVLGVAGDFGAKDGYLVPVPLYNGDIVVVSYQGERLERHPDVEAVLRGYALYFGVEGHRLMVRSRVQSGKFASLTSRQLQVLHLAALGYRDQDIAHELDIGIKTVEFHLARIRSRIGAANTKEAIAILHSAPVNTVDPLG